MKKFIIVYSAIMLVFTTACFRQMKEEIRTEQDEPITIYVIKYHHGYVYVYDCDGETLLGSYKWECGINKIDSVVNHIDCNND